MSIDESPSQPVPMIEVRRPSAERGGDDVRDHLDGKRCVFCGVPVAEDEEMIRMDKFGLEVFRPLCKNHHEHPECWKNAVMGGEDPEVWGFCPTCGEPTTQHAEWDLECSKCDPVELETREDRYV